MMDTKEKGGPAGGRQGNTAVWDDASRVGKAITERGAGAPEMSEGQKRASDGGHPEERGRGDTVANRIEETGGTWGQGRGREWNEGKDDLGRAGSDAKK